MRIHVAAASQVYLRLRLQPTGERCRHRNVPWLRSATAAASGAGRGCADPSEVLNASALLPVLRRVRRSRRTDDAA